MSKILVRLSFINIAIGGILKGKGKGNATSIGEHTAELAALSKKVGAAIQAGFGPDAGETYTKPYIWTDQVALNETVAQLVSSKENLTKAGLLAI